MINMCEKIAWGSDSALMDEAAERIEELESHIETQGEIIQTALNDLNNIKRIKYE